MDDGELKKATDKSSSSDEAEINNGGFPQWIRDNRFPFLHRLTEEEKSAQSRQKPLYGKCSSCSTAVPGEKKQTKPKKRHRDIKKCFDLESVSPSSESNASSESTDDESDVEKNVADHNRKYAIRFNKTSPYSLQQAYETVMPDDHNPLNRKPKKHEKGNEIFLPEERLELIFSNKEFNKSRSNMPTYRLRDHAVPSTSFSDSHAIPSTTFSDSHAIPSTSDLEDNQADADHSDLIDKFVDLTFGNLDKSSVTVNTSDFSDYENATDTTLFTHKKRKLRNKSHGHYKHDIELKKKRVERETRMRLPPFHLRIKKYSSEEDLTTHAKEERKFSSSSEADERSKENKKRPISEEERSSPQTQDSAPNFKISKRFKIEENCVSEEEKTGLFTKSI